MFGKSRTTASTESPRTTDTTEGAEPRSRHAAATTGDVVEREREEHGGVKLGSAFFGWLAATGMVVLLTALAAVTGLIAGEATGTDSADEVAGALGLQWEDLGIAGIVLALVIWFVAYYCGGYVAGRMARFDGIKQGIAVWVWSIVVTIVLAVLGGIAGNEYGAGGLPDVSLDGSTSTVIVAALIVLLTSLVGAMLGGLAGMRFHRRVDRTGLAR